MRSSADSQTCPSFQKDYILRNSLHSPASRVRSIPSLPPAVLPAQSRNHSDHQPAPKPGLRWLEATLTCSSRDLWDLLEGPEIDLPSLTSSPTLQPFIPPPAPPSAACAAAAPVPRPDAACRRRFRRARRASAGRDGGSLKVADPKD